jgi:hypothetical protein
LRRLPGCHPMTTHPTPEALAADFNRYFTSANGVDVPARVSVPRDEWRAVYAALSAELAAARAEAATERALSFRDQVAQLEAERDSLRAEVERLTPKWLPIETAPKGPDVLLWREDCGQMIGSFTSASAFPLSQDEIDAMDEGSLFSEDWFTQWPQAIRLDGSEAPTRWTPLPPAPPVAEGV